MLQRSLLAVESLLRRNTLAGDPAKVKQLLILEYLLPLGCCVHLTPLFESIKRCRPDIHLTVATRGIGAQVLRYSPSIDCLIETPDPLTDLPAAVASLRSSLHTLKLSPEAVFTGASDQRTRIALLAVLAAPGWRGGYTLKPMLYHRPLQYDSRLSLIANNLRLATLLGCEPTPMEPHVFFSPADRNTAAALLEHANPGKRPVVVMVTQTSGGQKTGWHLDRFTEVIKHSSQRLGCAVVFVGTSADASAIEELRQSSGDIGVSLAGKTSVTELAAILAAADAMVTLDTGTMHVGRAAGTPMVVLAPSWQRPIEWLPLTVANARVLRGPDRDAIPDKYRLDEISAESVISALADILHTYPPTTLGRQQRIERHLSTIDHRSAHRTDPRTPHRTARV